MPFEDQGSTVIPEDMLISMQLEAIFTPQLRKQREDAYNIQTEHEPAQKYARFVHYTSAEAGLSIIQNKRLWMRKTSCMSDFLEVEHGFDILRKCFGDQAKLARFTNTLDQCAHEAAQEAIDLFNQHLGNIRSSTYIASISEHNIAEELHGRLSMWRAFGGDTGRIAIILKIPWFTQGLTKGVDTLKVRFGPVAYIGEDDYGNEFQRMIDNISTHSEFLSSVGHAQIVSSVFNMLLTSTLCLKHYGFKEEKEWRVMYLPSLWKSDLMTSQIKVIGGVPQKVYMLPLDVSYDAALSELDMAHMFDRLIIGPTQYPWAMYEAFCETLSSIGVQDATQRVSVSNIPIRA